MKTIHANNQISSIFGGQLNKKPVSSEQKKAFSSSSSQGVWEAQSYLLPNLGVAFELAYRF